MLPRQVEAELGMPRSGLTEAEELPWLALGHTDGRTSNMRMVRH